MNSHFFLIVNFSVYKGKANWSAKAQLYLQGWGYIQWLRFYIGESLTVCSFPVQGSVFDPESVNCMCFLMMPMDYRTFLYRPCFLNTGQYGSHHNSFFCLVSLLCDSSLIFMLYFLEFFVFFLFCYVPQYVPWQFISLFCQVKKQQTKFSSALEKTLHLKFLRFMKYILEYVIKILKRPFIFLESKYWMD